MSTETPRFSTDMDLISRFYPEKQDVTVVDAISSFLAVTQDGEMGRG